jgi:defect-in-organelle-trafficking protein DotB
VIEIPPILQSRADLDSILTQAYQLEVSDVHIGGEDPIKVRLHGVIQNLAIRTLNTNEVASLLIASYDDNPSALSKVNSGEELDFSYVCQFPCRGEYLRWRVNAGSRRKYGQRDIKIVFRAIKSMPPDIETLGVESEIIELTTNIKKGLVVVTGATGSGKSTLLASILRRRAELGAEHMITAEAPIEYVYDGIETQSCMMRWLPLFEKTLTLFWWVKPETRKPLRRHYMARKQDMPYLPPVIPTVLPTLSTAC